MARYNRSGNSGWQPNQNRPARIEQKAVQNEMRPWQAWLRPGVLCVAREFLRKGWPSPEDERERAAVGFAGIYDLILQKGEHAIYIGELKRVTIGRDRVVVHTFFFAGGEWIADPQWFDPAFPDAEDEEK